MAEAVVDLLLTLRPVRSGPVLIGLTTEDMYMKRQPWRFTFSIRNPGGLAVVSRARMDPRLLGLTPDPGLRTRRLQKMVAKNIGALVFGHSLSGNPRSAMFDSILSVDDLDFMTEEFRPAPASRAKRSWLSGSSRVCKLGVSRRKALVSRSRITTATDFLVYMGELLEIEEERRSELAAIRQAPEDKTAIRVLLARLKRAHLADRAAFDELSTRWSDRTAKSWIAASARFSFASKADALELGSRPCGRYFDPATYG